MGIYSHCLLPRLIDFAMRQKHIQPYRHRVIGAAEGRVLEIGFGSGRNLPLYGAGARSVLGIEPSSELVEMARRNASLARVPVELVEGSAEALPVDDASVDTVVTTWTLCTIPDATKALRAARRVLRPAGKLLFVEHGRAPEPGVVRWQDRLDPIWSHLAGGCHLNRRIDALIADAGFRIDRLENSRVPVPKTHTFLYEGVASP
jgi:ubiquinone/menaquinone biosynthesis C-methylase UbiE